MEANYENTTDENGTILLHDVWADYRTDRTYFDQFPLRQSQQLSQKLKNMRVEFLKPSKGKALKCYKRKGIEIEERHVDVFA